MQGQQRAEAAIMPVIGEIHEREIARDELQKAQLIGESNPEASLELLLRAEKMDPRNATVLALLGRVQLRLGHFEESIKTYHRLSLMIPHHAEALSSLAYAQSKIGHYDQARDYALEALALDQGEITAREVLAECFVAEKDYKGCLRELNYLNQVLTEQGLARISYKAAFCFLKLGNHVKALEITSTLVEHGYDDDNISALYNLAQDMVRADIEN